MLRANAAGNSITDDDDAASTNGSVASVNRSASRCNPCARKACNTRSRPPLSTTENARGFANTSLVTLCRAAASKGTVPCAEESLRVATIGLPISLVNTVNKPYTA